PPRRRPPSRSGGRSRATLAACTGAARRRTPVAARRPGRSGRSGLRPRALTAWPRLDSTRDGLTAARLGEPVQRHEADPADEVSRRRKEEVADDEAPWDVSAVPDPEHQLERDHDHAVEASQRE